MKRLLVIAGLICALGFAVVSAANYAHATYRAMDPVAKAFSGIVKP